MRQGPDGPLSIGILFQAEASSLIDLLVPALADVGVELVPESTEGPGGLFPRKFMGAYDTILLFYPGPVGPGPEGDADYLRLIYAGGPMPTFFTPDGFDSSELMPLAEAQLVAQDEGERGYLLAQMQDIIAEQLVVLPLYYADQYFIFQKERLRRLVLHADRLSLGRRVQQAGLHHRPEDRDGNLAHRVTAGAVSPDDQRRYSNGARSLLSAGITSQVMMALSSGTTIANPASSGSRSSSGPATREIAVMIG